MANSNTIWHGVRLNCMHTHLYHDLYFWKTSLISQRQAYCTVFIFLLFAPAFIPVPSNPTDRIIILSCFKKDIQKHRASRITTWSQSKSKLISETNKLLLVSLLDETNIPGCILTIHTRAKDTSNFLVQCKSYTIDLFLFSLLLHFVLDCKISFYTKLSI